jgi:hypothetical protein
MWELVGVLFKQNLKPNFLLNYSAVTPLYKWRGAVGEDKKKSGTAAPDINNIMKTTLNLKP